MTHEFARNEAIRRTEAMQKTHYVVDTPSGFIVVASLATLPAKYRDNVVKIVNPEDVAALKANGYKHA